MKRIACAALAMGLMVMWAGAPVSAHHSFAAAYDMTKTVTVQGTITKIRLENPHSWFFLDVKDANGKIQQWAFEAGTPSGMIRNGFKPNVIKAGTEVTIKGVHAKDPSQNMGMLQVLTTSDGKVYGLFGPQQGPGAQ
jgi:hypothetical protein